MIISIKNLRAQTLIGIYPEERLAPRELVLNIRLTYDHSRAARSDKIEDAIDYAAIEQRIVESLAMQTFQLLETLAEHVAQLVLGFAGVEDVTVEIDKPGALKHAESVAVVHTARR